MGISQLNIKNVEIRLAQNDSEVEAAQHLRYRVFYDEYGAKPSEETSRLKRDFDDFDALSDHLIVVDKSIADPEKSIVGTYRLLRQDKADKIGRFYTDDEYDISPLTSSGAKLLELGRSCVLSDYRTRPVLQLLWEGIVDYMLDHNINLMFGCASLHGTDISENSEALAYLYHYHRTPSDVCPKAIKDRYVDMNLHKKEDLNPGKVFSALPPLIKGYLRVGSTIGDGAVIDHQFNTTDVCIVMQLDKMTDRYRKHYSRKLNRPFPEIGNKEGSQDQALN
jgi:putative hemolysin